jgi:hypothetical protein
MTVMDSVMNSFVETIYLIHYNDSVTGLEMTEYTDSISKVDYYALVHDNVTVMRGVCYFDPFEPDVVV